MINYRLDCSNLCSDFKEDISFQFSLGFTALLRRFTGNKSTSLLFQNNATKFMQNFPQQQQPGNDQLKKEMMSRKLSGSNLNSFALPNNGDQAGNLLVLLQGFQMATSRSNVVLVAVGGIVSSKLNETNNKPDVLISSFNSKVWRGLGWRILAITGSLYGLCYAYERLMWTRKTQEKLFKKQYADYASSKLKLIVDLTSQNAAGQVQQ